MSFPISTSHLKDLHVTRFSVPKESEVCGQTSTAPGGSKNSPEARGKLDDGHQGGTNDIASNIEKLHLSLHIVDWMFKKNACFFNQKTAWIFSQCFLVKLFLGEA